MGPVVMIGTEESFELGTLIFVFCDKPCHFKSIFPEEKLEDPSP